MRKIEKNGVLKVSLPDLDKINDDTKQNLVKLFSEEDFLDLSSVNARRSDFIWAGVLGAKNQDEMVEDVVALLQMEYDNRVQ